MVPVWEASQKQEYSARTIRPKIQRQLKEFLTEFPPVLKHPYQPLIKARRITWDKVFYSLQVDRNVPPSSKFIPGTRKGLQNLDEFARDRTKAYATQRNDPNVDALSKISPWRRFGQISVQRAALHVRVGRFYLGKRCGS